MGDDMEFAGGVDMGLSFNGTYYVESDKNFQLSGSELINSLLMA